MPKRSKRGRRGADASNVRKRAAQKGGGNSAVNLPGGVSFMKLEKGRMYIDVIPYEVTKANHPEGIQVGDLWYSRKYGMHFNVGPDERTVLCPKVTFGKRCPICEEYARLRKDVDADEDIVRGFKPKVRELFNIVKTEEDREQGVLDVSHYLFGAKLETEIQEGEEEIASFSHPDDGFTLKLRVVENDSLSNKFLEVDRIDFEDRDEEVSDEELEAAVNLDDALECKSYEEIEAILYGKDSAEEDEEAPRRKKSSRKKKVVEEDEEEEEERPARRSRRKKSEEEEDEEEEEKPRRRRKKSKAQEEDEEEEEPPRSRRRKKKPSKEEEDDWDDPEEDEEEEGVKVGSRVSADFDGEEYEGEVTEIDGDTATATVEFDDGSEEEMEISELTLL